MEVLYASIFGVNLQEMRNWGASNLSFPGCFAYGDMLEVGVTPGVHRGEQALTHSEARAHFGAWVVTSSPLILGLDVRDAAAVDAVWDILSNREALAISEAWAGGAGTLIARAATNVTWAPCGQQIASCGAGEWEVWSKPLPGGGAAVLALNHRGAGATADVSLPLAAVPGLACASACRVRDVWARSDNGTTAGGVWQVSGIPSHDSVFVTLMP